MDLLISYAILAGGIIVAAILARFALRLLTVDRIESKKSAARVSSLVDALMGRARTREDWLPDARVKGGMIYNKKKKRLEISGRLSDDSFDRVFR